jgi:hypothetical protein
MLLIRIGMWLRWTTRGLIITASIVLLGVTFCCIFVIPNILQPPLTQAELVGLTKKEVVDLENARRALRNQAMTTLLQAEGALLLLLTGSIGAYLLRGRPRSVTAQASELRECKFGITLFDYPCDNKQAALPQ